MAAGWPMEAGTACDWITAAVGSRVVQEAKMENPGVSRRAFLGKSASLVAAPAFFSVAGRKLRANPLGRPIGSQTYPHRQRIKDGDFAGLCKDLANLGVGNVELCSPAYSEFAGLSDAKQTRRIVEDHGLKCPSS